MTTSFTAGGCGPAPSGQRRSRAPTASAPPWSEHRPLTIHRDQHFHTRNTALSCTSHPIHDPLGRLAGLLDVSSCRADATAGVLGLIAAAVADAARAIEAQTFRQAFSQARIVLAGDPVERNTAALLAVDRDDLVIGATRAARLALSITDERIAAQLAASEVLGAGSVETELLEAERGAVRRALALKRRQCFGRRTSPGRQSRHPASQAAPAGAFAQSSPLSRLSQACDRFASHHETAHLADRPGQAELPVPTTSAIDARGNLLGAFHDQTRIRPRRDP
jgi:transcriptional regulator of acetoin/glycerol metabolism